jgi:hypothetical protein|tara:strand:+ start:3768 stop:6308 length:2541 start_codon:yes stop_codon:yes gene_type:complete
MSVENNPFDAVSAGPSVVEVVPSPDGLEEDQFAIEPAEDGSGGIIVEFKPAEPAEGLNDDQVEEDDEEFYRNLVEEITDEEVLTDISDIVLKNFEADKASRTEWESMFERGFDLLGLKLEEATEPFEGACTAVHPILIESAVKFQSKASQEMFPAGGPVKAQILGDYSDEKQEQSTRIKNFMNYQVTTQMPEYFNEMERKLFHLPIIGSAFKKTYFDRGLNRPCSEFVPIDQFYVSNNAKDLATADRYTHVIPRTVVDLERDVVAGLYSIDIEEDLGEPYQPEVSGLSEKMDNIMGTTQSGDGVDTQYVLLEQHVYLNIDGFEDEVSLPYIVTIEEQSSKILSIYRNYDREDPRKIKKTFFTHYKYVPGFGFYGLGLIHFLGNLTMTATAAMRSLIDAGQFANLPGGFKAKGVRIVGDNDAIAPGEFKEIEAVGTDIRQMIMPLPYKEPSQTLFQMLGFVTAAAGKFADSTEQMISDASSYGPVGTTMALLEASSKFFSAIHKRLHNSQKEEFRILARLNYENLPDECTCDVPGASLTIYREDFDGRIDIIPVSDPNIPSSAHRMMMAQMALQLSQSAPPGMYNTEELHKTILNSASMPNIDAIMPSKPQAIPLDPVSDIGAAVKGIPIKAFPGQNHDAHIQTKMMYLQDPMNGANPLMQRISPVLEANMQEHMLLKYQEQMNGVARQIAPPEAAGNPQMMEAIMAQAAQQVKTANEVAAAQQQALTPEAQMVQMEGKRLELETEKLKVTVAKEAVSGALKSRELDIKEQELQLDMFKDGAKMKSSKDEKERDRNAKQAIVALQGLMDLAIAEAANDTTKQVKATDLFGKLAMEATKKNGPVDSDK